MADMTDTNAAIPPVTKPIKLARSFNSIFRNEIFYLPKEAEKVVVDYQPVNAALMNIACFLPAADRHVSFLQDPSKRNEVPREVDIKTPPLILQGSIQPKPEAFPNLTTRRFQAILPKVWAYKIVNEQIFIHPYFLANVMDYGDICWGGELLKAQSLHSLRATWNLFINTPFNMHLFAPWKHHNYSYDTYDHQQGTCKCDLETKFIQHLQTYKISEHSWDWKHGWDSGSPDALARQTIFGKFKKHITFLAPVEALFVSNEPDILQQVPRKFWRNTIKQVYYGTYNDLVRQWPLVIGSAQKNKNGLVWDITVVENKAMPAGTGETFKFSVPIQEMTRRDHRDWTVIEIPCQPKTYTMTTHHGRQKLFKKEAKKPAKIVGLASLIKLRPIENKKRKQETVKL